MSDFTPQNIANIMMAYAKLELEFTPSLLEAVSKTICRNIGVFKSQNVANTIWAIATMKVPESCPMVRVLVSIIPKIAPMCIPQETANILWALAKMKAHHAEAVRSLGDRALTTCREFNEQDVVNVLWAFATFGNKQPQELIEALLAAALKKCVGFIPQDIGNFMWSIATMDIQLDDRIWKGWFSPSTHPCFVDVGGGRDDLGMCLSSLFALSGVGERDDFLPRCVGWQQAFQGGARFGMRHRGIHAMLNFLQMGEPPR